MLFISLFLVSQERVVHLKREKVGGLGLSVKGGAEHNLPILISRIFKDQAGKCWYIPLWSHVVWQLITRTVSSWISASILVSSSICVGVSWCYDVLGCFARKWDVSVCLGADTKAKRTIVRVKAHGGASYVYWWMKVIEYCIMMVITVMMMMMMMMMMKILIITMKDVSSFTSPHYLWGSLGPFILPCAYKIGCKTEAFTFE